jgi:uncharacterized membrane protein
MSPQLISYLMSFVTLGIFWNGQQTQLNRFARADRQLTWIHLAFLFAVTLMPSSTKLLAEFIVFRIALLCHSSNVLIFGIVLYLSWFHASRASLLKEDTTAEVGRAVRRRIVVAQALYGFGALLCAVNTYVSIGFIVAVQLNLAIAPRIRFLNRL